MMNSRLLEQNIAKALSLILSKLLGDIRQSSANLTETSEDEALHDIRVAARRMNTWLKIIVEKKIITLPKLEQNKLKHLIKTTNGVRDLEVRLAIFRKVVETDSGIRREPFLHEVKWEKKIEKGYVKILNELPGHIKVVDVLIVKLLGKLNKKEQKDVSEVEFGALMRPILQDYALELDESLKKIKSIKDEEKSHQARLSAKKLRYLLEPIAGELPDGISLLQEMRRIQDLLGDLRDAMMLSDRLKRIEKQKAVKTGDRKLIKQAHEKTKLDIRALFEEIAKDYLSAGKIQFSGLLAKNYAKSEN